MAGENRKGFSEEETWDPKEQVFTRCISTPGGDTDGPGLCEGR